MLLSVIKYFKGYVYVRLSGYAPERFLNLCGSHDILIWNLKSTEDGYEFCISVAGFKQLRPILKKQEHISASKKDMACRLNCTITANGKCLQWACCYLQG